MQIGLSSHSPRHAVTQRIAGVDTYNLKYDAGNHLVEEKKNNAVIASFIGVYPELVKGTATGDRSKPWWAA